MKNRKKYFLIIFLAMSFMFIYARSVHAAPNTMEVPNVNISVGG